MQYKQWRAETVGCPGQTRFLDTLEFFSNKFLKKIFVLVVHQNLSNSSRKISDDLFLSRSPNIFSNSSPKISGDFILVIYPNVSYFFKFSCLKYQGVKPHPDLQCVS